MNQDKGPYRHFPKPIEETAKIADVLKREKLARPVDQGRDILELTDKMRINDPI